MNQVDEAVLVVVAVVVEEVEDGAVLEEVEVEDGAADEASSLAQYVS